MSSRHLNPYFHWCARCWKWVCDCVHCVEPLNVKRLPVKDVQIWSLRREGSLRRIAACGTGGVLVVMFLSDLAIFRSGPIPHVPINGLHPIAPLLHGRLSEGVCNDVAGTVGRRK